MDRKTQGSHGPQAPGFQLYWGPSGFIRSTNLMPEVVTYAALAESAINTHYSIPMVLVTCADQATGL